MPMSKEDCLKAALSMIQVTPGNYKKLNASMILYLCKVVATAEEKLYKEPSVYEGKTPEQIKERISL